MLAQGYMPESAIGSIIPKKNNRQKILLPEYRTYPNQQTKGEATFNKQTEMWPGPSVTCNF